MDLSPLLPFIYLFIYICVKYKLCPNVHRQRAGSVNLIQHTNTPSIEPEVSAQLHWPPAKFGFNFKTSSQGPQGSGPPLLLHIWWCSKALTDWPSSSSSQGGQGQSSLFHLFRWQSLKLWFALSCYITATSPITFFKQGCWGIFAALFYFVFISK